MDSLEDTRPTKLPETPKRVRLFEVDNMHTYTGGLRSDEEKANRAFLGVLIVLVVLFIVAKLSGL